MAILSDIHANLPALEAVLRDIRGRGVDAMLHAGDVVGYYPYPNEVVEALRGENVRSILGNHDRAVLSGEDHWFNPTAATALRWTRTHTDPLSMGFLRSLPPRLAMEIGPRHALMVHGSPKDGDEYVYAHDVVEELFPGEVELVIMGHTHVPYIKALGYRLALNPGSVGQPRDGDPRASYALLESEEGSASLHRVDYPVAKVAAAVEEAGLPRFLGLRLFEGV